VSQAGGNRAAGGTAGARSAQKVFQDSPRWRESNPSRSDLVHITYKEYLKEILLLLTTTNTSVLASRQSFAPLCFRYSGAGRVNNQRIRA